MLYTIPHSNLEHNFPIRLKLLAINHKQDPICRPCGLSLYQWFYCVKGKGSFVLNQQRSIISEGEGFLLYPNVSHSYRAFTSDWNVHCFGFDGTLCQELLNSLNMHEPGAYHFSNSKIFIDHIQTLDKLRLSTSIYRREALSAECYRFLIDLSQSITRLNDSELIMENELIRALIAYMEENYNTLISLSDLAERVNLSREHICRVFKQEIGQTIIQYLQKLRINRAKIFLLQYPEKRVVEIAQMCGMENSSYFGKVFKEEVGMTPDTFRKYRL